MHSFPIEKPSLLNGEFNSLMNFPILGTLELICSDLVRNISSESKKTSTTGNRVGCHFLQVCVLSFKPIMVLVKYEKI